MISRAIMLFGHPLCLTSELARKHGCCAYGMGKRSVISLHVASQEVISDRNATKRWYDRVRSLFPVGLGRDIIGGIRYHKGIQRVGLR